MRLLRIMLNAFMVTVLVIIKMASAFIAVMALLWSIYLSGPYDVFKNKTVAPASTEDFNSLDDTLISLPDSVPLFPVSLQGHDPQAGRFF